MSQSSNHQNPIGRRRKTAFAFGAVLVMVGVAFAATMYVTKDTTSPTHAFGSGSEADPVASLRAMSAPLEGLDGASSTINQSGALQAQASGRLQSAIVDAQGRVDAAAGVADPILAGTDGGIEAYLKEYQGYDLADLQTKVGGQTGTGFLWTQMPSTVVLEGDEVRFEPTGTAEADAVLLQVEAVIAQVQAMWSGAEVQTLFATVDQTAAEKGAPIRVPGLVRSPFGAEDAVEPDGDGALVAQAHADALLGTVGQGYGDLYTGLQNTRAGQVGLAGEVDGALATAAKFRDEARAAVATQHTERLDGIAFAGIEYEARLSQAAGAYTDGLAAVAAQAETDIDAALAQQIATVDGGAAEAGADVDAWLAAIQDQADVRLAGIAEAEAAVRAGVESGAIAVADAEAFMAASAAARAQIDAQVTGAESHAAAIKAQLRSAADAQIEQLNALAADAHAEIDAKVAQSTAWAEAQVAMLLGTVDGALDDASAVQTEIRAAAEAAIDQVVASHASQVEVRAYAAIEEARAYASSAASTVAIVQGQAYAEVGNDLAYIQAVIDDYASIPTPERQAAAAAFTAAHGQIDATLGGVLVTGGQISAEAMAVMQAAAQAEAALDARF